MDTHLIIKKFRYTNPLPYIDLCCMSAIYPIYGTDLERFYNGPETNL